MKIRRVAMLLVIGLLSGPVLQSCSATAGSGSVSVLASWTGNEETAFRKVLGQFTADTGIQVSYQGTRALDQVLESDIQRGTAPDVAVLPNPSAFGQYIRSGDLHPLDIDKEAQADFDSQWLDLQKFGTGKQYAVAIKADLKSAIWYNTKTFTDPRPSSWDDVAKLAAGNAAPWCLGMGAPPVSGWPGTDWVEDILLHTAGPDVYRQFSSGALAWNSSAVRSAWEKWGSLVTSARRGNAGALLTDFSDAGEPMFANPPGCVLEHQGSFIMSYYRGMRRAGGGAPQPGIDFDFFRTPGLTVSEVSADLAGMFHDTAEARALMSFLASARAQRIWPMIPGSGAFSVNKQVPLDVYADQASGKVAEILTSDPNLCFDASDLMPAAMTNAFYRGVLEYLSDPSQLTTILKQLESVRKEIPKNEWLNVPCGQ